MDINYAKKLLKEGNYTCVLCKEDIVYTSELRGVAPMVNYLNKNTDLKGFYIADKIVGKAVALLFILAGIKEVYAEVISESALIILSKYKIIVSYNICSDKIINRTGTDICPMEKAVLTIEDPQIGFEKIKETLSQNFKNKV